MRRKQALRLLLLSALMLLLLGMTATADQYHMERN